MAGKYRVLDAIYKKHPNIILEECSYGSRQDYGMARTSCVNWLSDATTPSSLVRDNVMAAAYVLPSGCNFTWVVQDDEVTHPQTAAFLDTIIRSRMMGSFGFGTLHANLSECVSLYPPSVIEAAVRNVKAYKSFRHLLMENVYHLTPWGKTKAWQIMQFAAQDREEGVVFLFRNGSQETSGHATLRGLDPHRKYELMRLNTGSKEVLSGAKLMQSGVAVDLSQDPQASEILQLKIISQ
jgi:alpha-galactosidase